MVPVSGGHCLDVDAVDVKVMVLSAGQRIGGPDHSAVRLLRYLAQVVVILVFVGDEDQIGWQIIALAGKGVNIDDRAGMGGDAAACMSLKEQFSHNDTSLYHSLCLRKQNVTAKKIARYSVMAAPAEASI